MLSNWPAATAAQVCSNDSRNLHDFMCRCSQLCSVVLPELDADADSTVSKEREAQLVNECESLQKQVARLIKEAEELRSENIPLEHQHHNSALEAGHKTSELATAKMQAQHEAAILQEKVRAMHDEMRQHKQSNDRLLKEVQDSYQQMGHLRMWLEEGNREVGQDIEVMEKHVHNVAISFETQIGGCYAQLDVLQADCQTQISSVQTSLEAVQVRDACAHAPQLADNKTSLPCDAGIPGK